MRDPVAPHFLSTFSVIRIFYSSTWWYLTVVLICISLKTSGVDHFFTYLFVICIPSLVKYLLIVFPFLN